MHHEFAWFQVADSRRWVVCPPAPPAVEPGQLPPWRFQHAVHSEPDFRHGSCADDNARAPLVPRAGSD